MGSRCERAIVQARQTCGAHEASLPKLLSVARSCLQHDISSQRFFRRQLAEDLAKWASTKAPGIIEACLADIPRLKVLAGAVRALPCAAHACLEAQHPTAVSAAMAHKIVTSARQSNLGSCLLEQWGYLHEPILHEKSPPIIEQPAACAARPPCVALGMCVCSASGKQREIMRQRFHRALKTACPKKSYQLALLKRKQVVAKLTPGQPAAAPSCDVWSTAAAAEIGASTATVNSVIYWHIAHTSFKPLECSMRELTLLQEERRPDGMQFLFEVNPIITTKSYASFVFLRV